jgi:hypothetical protein
VDTDVRLGSTTQDALRSQTPLFGIDTYAEFEVDDKSFGLLFEDGLWGTPAVPMRNSRDDDLVSWKITFVYTKSGDGAIQTITYDEPVYTEQDNDVFRVHYHWEREADVRLNAGQNVMFAMVVVASFIILLASCVDPDEKEGSSDGNGPIQGSSVPKWD